MTSTNQKVPDQRAFERQLPNRIGQCLGRIRAMAENGWDVNVLYLVNGEVEELARTAAEFSLSPVGEKLYELKAVLTICVESGRIPTEQELTAINARLMELDAYSAETVPDIPKEKSITRELRIRLPEPEVDLSGLPALSNIPHYVIPPRALIAGREALAPSEDLVLEIPKPAIANDGEEDEGEIGVVMANDPFDIDGEQWIEEALADDDDDADFLFDDETGFPTSSDESKGDGAGDPVPDAGSEMLVEDEEEEDDLGLERASVSQEIPAIGFDDEPAHVGETATRAAPTHDIDEDIFDVQDALMDAAADFDNELMAAADALDIDDEDALGVDLDEIDALLNDDAFIDTDAITVLDSGGSHQADDGVVETGESLSASSSEAGREPAHITVYILHAQNSLQGVAEALASDHDVQGFEDVEEFIEVLSAIGPHAVVIDEAHFDRATDIGAIVRKLRSKTALALPFLAVGEVPDLGSRLGLLRAGTDAVISPKAGVQGISLRIRELLDSSPDDPYRVLIVEDDRSQAIFAQSILRRAGLVVELEKDPLAVPERMSAFEPDLVLMDLHMPGCDGMELTAIIRENERFVGVPIVFLSGEDDVDTHFEALQAGGDDFLAKPIKPKHLISAVLSRVRRARATAEAVAIAPETSGMVRKGVLLEALDQVVEDESMPREEASGGIIFVELDNPLELRRRIGLPGLDELSDHLGDLLGGMLAPADLMARFTDQSYILWVPDASEASLERLARMAIEAVASQRFDLKRGSTVATVSAGIALLTEDIESTAEWVDRAERACNENVDEGVSRMGIHRPASASDEDPETRDMGERILEALDQDGFQLVYQPVASLQGEETEHYQCLLRLPQGEHVIPPLEIIAVAEKLGMMPEIDRWVLDQALQVLEQGASRPKALRLFVNQSVEAIESMDMADWLMEAMRKRRIAGTGLILEFKLREIAGALREAVQLHEALAPLQVRVCLSMFDCTESAYSALTHFRPDFVKFGARIAADKVRQGTMAEAVDRLHDLNAKVIVPAVEEAQAAVELWTAGADYIQGNFVQPPSAELNYQFANVL